MNDVEKKLLELELLAPSKKQDQRMAGLFADPPTSSSLSWPRLSLLQIAIACIVCMVFGYWLNGENPVLTPVTTPDAESQSLEVYFVDAPESFQGNAFNWSDHKDPEINIVRPETIINLIGATIHFPTVEN